MRFDVNGLNNSLTREKYTTFSVWRNLPGKMISWSNMENNVVQIFLSYLFIYLFIDSYKVQAREQ